MVEENRNFRRIFWALTGIALIAAGSAHAQQPLVAVTAIVEHPALDAVRDGLRDQLAEEGFENGKNIRFVYESAQGEVVNARQIASQFVGDDPAVMVGIATPSAQALVAASQDLPIVYSAVTDPRGAKISPRSNVTGVSDLSPIDKHMELISRLTPNVKRLGVVSNPGEANSVALVALVREFAPQFDMTVTVAAAPKTADVRAATQSLVGKVDAIYVPTDNTVISAFETLIAVADRANLPVYAGDTESVPKGALAAAGFDYYDVGRQTGEMVAKILRGTQPNLIREQTVQKTRLHLNQKKAEQLGIRISESVSRDAVQIIR